MGLSVNWATYNIGATSVEEVGIPFVVGTTIKWERKNNMTVDYLIGHREDFSGNPEYDAAACLWGNGWRTPTDAEWDELLHCCKWKKDKIITSSGLKIPGHRIIGPNGNSIFLHFTLGSSGKIGEYQSSSVSQDPRYPGVMVYLPPIKLNYNAKRAKTHDIGFHIRPVINKIK